MDTLIVFVDDAEYAWQMIAPLRSPATRTHWVLVAMPPRLTRHASRWVSHGARQQWRESWSQALFSQLKPRLCQNGDTVSTEILTGDPRHQMRDLELRHGTERALDARRPRLGQELPPLTADQSAVSNQRWVLPGAAATLGAVLVLAAE